MIEPLMGIQSPVTPPADLNAAALSERSVDHEALREAFDSFVGQTFYGQLLKSLRSTVKKAAYFDGGRAEEIFEGQLDQVMAEKMAKADRGLSDSMFDLFMLNLKQS